MHPDNWRLINGQWLEAIPAKLANARANSVARILATSDWLIRRKSDGRFLATRKNDTITELQRNALTPLFLADLMALADLDNQGQSPRPMTGLLSRLHALGLEESDYATRTSLSLVAEPCVLSYAGKDRFSRPLWLTHSAASAWLRMRQSALTSGIFLDAISGYRSHDYQLGIFRRKLKRGSTIEQILLINAAPGFSEHHGGFALDIGTQGQPPAEESFEFTDAFAWLMAHAAEFGFELSYPRGNRHGITYEPWHWRHCE